MSYEVWGDDDDGMDGFREHYLKQLIEDGWLDDEAAAALRAERDALAAQLATHPQQQEGGKVRELLRELVPALDAYELNGRRSYYKDGVLHWEMTAQYWESMRLRERVETALAQPPHRADIERGLETPRRMAAVELLLAQGWKWNGEKWVQSQQPGEVTGVSTGGAGTEFFRTRPPGDVAVTDEMVEAALAAPFGSYSVSSFISPKSPENIRRLMREALLAALATGGRDG